jgi:hypothetical protein
VPPRRALKPPPARAFSCQRQSPREEVVLFLEADGPGTFGVVNLAEGKFRVVRPTGCEPRVERDLSGIGHLQDAIGSGVPSTLDGLTRAVVEAHRASGRR